CTAYFTCRRFPWLKSAYRACLIAVLFTTALANGIFFLCSIWLSSGLAVLVVTCLSSAALCAVGLVVFRRHLAGLR
ncbi:hypothetical protein DKX15_16770, partial [Enterococcus faecium]